MSVSDPSLKALKGFVLKFKTEDSFVDDESPALQSFCENLEGIFRKGLKQPSYFLYQNTKHFWNWIEGIPKNVHGFRFNHKLESMISAIKQDKNTQTALGKGRLFLRVALKENLLLNVVEYITGNADLQDLWYDSTYAVLGNDILSEIFKSLVIGLKDITFRLRTKNAAFLDDTWSLPVYRGYEFVPCKRLGLTIHITQGRAIATGVREDGVAGEDNKIEPGDIINEIQGEVLRKTHLGKITTLLKQLEGLPLYICVIKCRKRDGTVYYPIRSLITSAGLDIDLSTHVPPANADEGGEEKPLHALLAEDINEQLPVHNDHDKVLYHVQYIGKESIGPNGGVAYIDRAITEVLKKPADQIVPQDVTLELGEKDVIVTDKSTQKVTQVQSYTGIASCGHKIDTMEYFAFLAGETTCTISKNFVGYVFKSKSVNEAKTIICAIAQGFERTHWFV